MTAYIHAKKKETKFEFRVWDTIIENYVSKPLNEQAVIEFCMNPTSATMDGEPQEQILEMIDNAKKFGNSDPCMPRSFVGEWSNAKLNK